MSLVPNYCSKVRSLAITIPSAAARTTGVFTGVPDFLKARFTGVPDFLKARRNFFTSSSSSQRVRGQPRFLDAMLTTSVPGEARNSSRYRFLNRRTVLLTTYGISWRNFRRAAALPFFSCIAPYLCSLGVFKSGINFMFLCSWLFCLLSGENVLDRIVRFSGRILSNPSLLLRWKRASRFEIRGDRHFNFFSLVDRRSSRCSCIRNQVTLHCVSYKLYTIDYMSRFVGMSVSFSIFLLIVIYATLTPPYILDTPSLPPLATSSVCITDVYTRCV